MQLLIKQMFGLNQGGHLLFSNLINKGQRLIKNKGQHHPFLHIN
jgi:hypothetical protein